MKNYSLVFNLTGLQFNRSEQKNEKTGVHVLGMRESTFINDTNAKEEK